MFSKKGGDAEMWTPDPTEESRHRCERTEHANLARQTARGQRRFSVVVVVVVVMGADVVPQVGGARGHPEGWGTEEARTEWACVRTSQGGEGVVKGGWVDGGWERKYDRWIVLFTHHAGNVPNKALGFLFLLNVFTLN